MAGPKIGTNRGNAGKGRPKNAPNKITKQLKDMILGALDDAGGQKYLAARAKDSPAAFLTLVGKVLPLQIGGDPDGVPIMTAASVLASAPDEVVRWLASQRTSDGDGATTH